MRPIYIPKKIKAITESVPDTEKQIRVIKSNYYAISSYSAPLVSIVIPAFNQAEYILQALHSLSLSNTNKLVQIIIVDNSSTDNTAQLVEACGITCVIEKTKGITAARNAGLKSALGKYILHAEADAIYPANWIDAMIDPMEQNNAIGFTYGQFAYLSIKNKERFGIFLNEMVADILGYFKKYVKNEAFQVPDTNFGYKRLDGINIERNVRPDVENIGSFLAVKVRSQSNGKLHFVNRADALVWTLHKKKKEKDNFYIGLKNRYPNSLFSKQFDRLQTEL